MGKTRKTSKRSFDWHWVLIKPFFKKKQCTYLTNQRLDFLLACLKNIFLTFPTILFCRSLSSNQLSTLPKELIEGTSRLDTLTLDDNPWVCDCRLNWLILWLQSTTRVSRSAASTKIPICMEPIGYQGQRLTSIRPLQCSEGKWLFHNQRHLVGNKANKLSFPCKASS